MAFIAFLHIFCACFHCVIIFIILTSFATIFRVFLAECGAAFALLILFNILLVLVSDAFH